MMAERILFLLQLTQRIPFKSIGLFLAGFFLGWWVMGWWLWPVSWTDAAPQHLHPSYQEDYLRMAIDSYRVNRNAGLAQQRFLALGEQGRTLLEKIMANPGPQSPEDIQAFALVVTGAEAQAGPAQPSPPAQAGGRAGLMGLVVVLSLIVLLGLVGAVAVFVVVRRSRAKQRRRERAKQERAETAFASTETLAGETPLRHQVFTFRLGDDFFDESFAIETEAGEFLGEGGINLSESLNPRGSPKQAAAFEVWLFDKNDIQTVTKVLVPPGSSPELLNRVQDKGEVVEASEGAVIPLETSHLRVEVRLTEAAIEQSPQGPYFSRLVTEFLVWLKEGEPAAGTEAPPVVG